MKHDKEYFPTAPKPLDVLYRFREDLLANFHCHKLGRIDKFDAAKQTATVEIVGRLVVGGKEVAYPLLVDCPVWVQRGGGGYLSFPVNAGDYCLVLFNDRDIDRWHETGQSYAPNTYRMHDISDGLVLLGWAPQTSVIDGYSTTESKWVYTNTSLATDGEKWEIKNNVTSLLTALTGLTAALKAAKDTRGDTFDSATVTAITAAETLIKNLLK